jgi:uncharacterized membrane protein SpoIIM required for sporulation
MSIVTLVTVPVALTSRLRLAGRARRGTTSRRYGSASVSALVVAAYVAMVAAMIGVR